MKGIILVCCMIGILITHVFAGSLVDRVEGSLYSREGTVLQTFQ